MHSIFQRITTSILSLSLLLFLVGCVEKEADNRSLQTIVKPFAGFDLPKSVVQVNPKVDQKVPLDKGMSLDVPASAFVDEAGKVVQKPVTLIVEYYHTTSEILASGIPMSYEENRRVSNFESAGMFKIEGTVDGQPVFINPEKEIYINSTSSTYGDYDAYYFQEENTSKSSVSGTWKRVSGSEELKDSTQVLDTFRLQLDTISYPELAGLSKINWQLANAFYNPKDTENQWVMKEQWTSLQISQPKFGIGEKLFRAALDRGELRKFGSVQINNDGTRIIASKQSKVHIWNQDGKLLKEIDGLKDSNWAIKLIDDTYMVIESDHHDVLYDLDGNKICELDHSYNHHISKDRRRIIYNLWGEIGIVIIRNFAGEKLKVIELESDKTDYWNGIVPMFDITSEDLLITNSIEGIHFYDLNGKLLKHREGEYQSFRVINHDIVLLEEVSGQLTLWNHRQDTEVTSKSKDFDLSTRLIEGQLKYASFYPIPETGHVFVHEADEDFPALWNTQSNLTKTLSFQIYLGSPIELWKNGLIEGFDQKKKEYHLYDIHLDKSILTIPNFDMCLYCDFIAEALSGGYISISENNHFLLIQNRLYTITGDLIKDFKQSDANVFKSGFLSDSTLYSLTKTGVLYHWNIKGETLSQRQLVENAPTHAWSNKKSLTTYNSILKEQSVFDWSGELLYAIPFPGLRKITNPLAFLYESNEGGEIILESSFLLGSHVYQLSLLNEENTFVTYVYLNDDQKRKVNQYLKARFSRVNQELDRRAKELQVKRSFRVANFGIYNWDRLIKEEGMTTFAATFEFDRDMSFNEVRIFHITEIDGRAVVEYGKEGSPNFSFGRKLPNQLIAVLPHNKIALFDQASFDRLDSDAIQTSGAYTFKMKTQPDSLVDLNQLANILN